MLCTYIISNIKYLTLTLLIVLLDSQLSVAGLGDTK